jgi:hypothetical protein
MNGTRTGVLLDGFAQERLPLADDNMQRRRQVEWYPVDYGDYIIGIHGNYRHNPNLMW